MSPWVEVCVCVRARSRFPNAHQTGWSTAMASRGEPSLVDEVPDALECQLCRVLATLIQATLHLLRWKGSWGHRDCLGNFGAVDPSHHSFGHSHLLPLLGPLGNMCQHDKQWGNIKVFSLGMCVCERMRDLTQVVQLRENGSRKRHHTPPYLVLDTGGQLQRGLVRTSSQFWSRPTIVPWCRCPNKSWQDSGPMAGNRQFFSVPKNGPYFHRP